MIKINLLPVEIIKRQRLSQERKYLIFGGAGVFAILIIYALINGLLIGVESAREASLNKKNSEMKKIIEKMNEVTEYQRKINKNTKFSKKLIDNRINWTAILKELFDNTPKEIWYKKVYFSVRSNAKFREKGRFELTGYAAEKYRDKALKLPENLKAKTENFKRATYEGQFEKIRSFKQDSPKKFIHFKITRSR